MCHSTLSLKVSQASKVDFQEIQGESLWRLLDQCNDSTDASVETKSSVLENCLVKARDETERGALGLNPLSPLSSSTPVQ